MQCYSRSPRQRSCPKAVDADAGDGERWYAVASATFGKRAREHSNEHDPTEQSDNEVIGQ